MVVVLRYSGAMQSVGTPEQKQTAWSFRLPEDLLEDFKRVAKAENRSTAGALRYLMEQQVAEHKAAAREPVSGVAA